MEKKLLEELKKDKDIVAVYQFGSYGTKKYNPKLSDLDLCIFTKNPPNKARILELMASGTDKIDLSIFDNLPIYIKSEVFRGKPLFVKDKYFIADKFAKAMRNYWDFQRYQKKYWKQIQSRWVKDEKN